VRSSPGGWRDQAYRWVSRKPPNRAVLVFTGDDPERYEPRPESDVFGRLEFVPFAGPDVTGLRVRGVF